MIGFPKVDADYAAFNLDFLLFKIFSPAARKLIPQVILQGFHFCFCERFLQTNRGAGHELAAPDFQRGMALSTFSLTPGFHSFLKQSMTIPRIMAVAAFHSAKDRAFVFG